MFNIFKSSDNEAFILEHIKDLQKNNTEIMCKIATLDEKLNKLQERIDKVLK